MVTGPDDVRFQERTESSRPTTKMSRLTQSGPETVSFGPWFLSGCPRVEPWYHTTSSVQTLKLTSVFAPYRDLFGNWCSRMVAPAGRMRLAADGVVRDSGLPDPVFASAIQHAVEDLPPTRWSICLAAAIAKRTGFRKLHGSCSRRRRQAGHGSRPSAISSIATSHSDTSTPGPPRRPGKSTTKAKAYAATTDRKSTRLN